MPSSFYAEFAHAALEREIERLRAQVNIGWDKERRVLAESGLRDGLSLAEVGSGPCLFAEAVIAQYPRIRVTAIDYDHLLLSRSRQHIAPAMLANVRLLCASAADIGIASNTFDFALARFTLQHLPDPVSAVREMYRVLKPGGGCVIIDSDDGLGTLFSPPLQAMNKIALKISLAQAFQGGNRRIGRRLWRILHEAGFCDLTFDSLSLHSDEVGLEAFRALFNPEYLLPLIESGLITQEEWEEARQSLEQFFANPDSLIIDQRLIVRGVKPQAEA